MTTAERVDPDELVGRLRRVRPKPPTDCPFAAAILRGEAGEALERLAVDTEQIVAARPWLLEQDP